MDQEQPWVEEFGVLVVKELNMTQQHALTDQEAKGDLGSIKRNMISRAWYWNEVNFKDPFNPKVCNSQKNILSNSTRAMPQLYLINQSEHKCGRQNYKELYVID